LIGPIEGDDSAKPSSGSVLGEADKYGMEVAEAQVRLGDGLESPPVAIACDSLRDFATCVDWRAS
jgi:hypothetical protein